MKKAKPQCPGGSTRQQDCISVHNTQSTSLPTQLAHLYIAESFPGFSSFRSIHRVASRTEATSSFADPRFWKESGAATRKERTAARAVTRVKDRMFSILGGGADLEARRGRNTAVEKERWHNISSHSKVDPPISARLPQHSEMPPSPTSLVPRRRDRAGARR